MEKADQQTNRYHEAYCMYRRVQGHRVLEGTTTDQGILTSLQKEKAFKLRLRGDE